MFYIREEISSYRLFYGENKRSLIPEAFSRDRQEKQKQRKQTTRIIQYWLNIIHDKYLQYYNIYNIKVLFYKKVQCNLHIIFLTKNKAFSRNKTQKYYCKNMPLWFKKIVRRWRKRWEKKLEKNKPRRSYAFDCKRTNMFTIKWCL